MPQGKLKVKTKLPNSLKKKPAKGPSNTRKNKPTLPKKTKHEEADKLKKIITRNVNRKFELELRSLATGRPNAGSSKTEFTAESNKMPPVKKDATEEAKK